MQRILLLDNFDSFTYNLEHYLIGLGAEVNVIRNNVVIPDLTIYDKIIVSPGPGLPEEAGSLMEVLDQANGVVPILGVCLGMQGVAIHLGGGIYNQKEVKHGVQERVKCFPSALFKFEEEIEVGLYHSWAVHENPNYRVSAVSEGGVIMAIENADRNLYGVQFHPESIMTPNGMNILKNFLELT